MKRRLVAAGWFAAVAIVCATASPALAAKRHKRRAPAAPVPAADEGDARRAETTEDARPKRDVPPPAADERVEVGGDDDSQDIRVTFPRKRRTPAATDASVVGFFSLGLAGRQFHYNQRVTNANLRPYDLPQSALLPVTPGASFALEVYPFAATSAAVARDIGLTGRLDYNVAKAQVGEEKLNTRWYAWEANLRTRFHLGPRGASPVVALTLGAGRQVFEFQGDAATTDILPGVDYRFLRAALDGRVPVGAVALTVSGGYRRLLTTTNAAGETIVAAGSVGEHFPRAAIAGIDARGGVALPLSGGVEARVAVGYVRYWAAFNPRPGDAYVAGGAVDQMINAEVGVAAFF